MTQPHSASAEEQSLKLVEDFNDELKHALDSLGDKKPNPDTLINRYRFWSAKHLQRAYAGFALLRRSGYIDSSKFLVRPSIEMFIRLETARQHPDLYYRVAATEHHRDAQMLRERDKLLTDKTQSEEDWKIFEENWQRFVDAFTEEFPDVAKSDDVLDMASAATRAKLESFYGSHYRIYSQYTHGALRASMGYLDPATDPEDNRIMSICALAALEALISIGAKSPNHKSLEKRLSRFSA
jgi:Family of unknown function (DUF5677)